MSVSYVAEMTFDRGEEVHIKSIIKPKCEQEIPFTIRSAKWALMNLNGDVLQEGECAITDHEIDSFVKFDTSGTFCIRYEYVIGDETWVDNVKAKVG